MINVSDGSQKYMRRYTKDVRRYLDKVLDENKKRSRRIPEVKNLTAEKEEKRVFRNRE
ncbi:hypothetical protein [Methanosarcina barkeri]|uniref:hypothetical protein n=1 Tax=Methanosarcina barkeri TaxID=2208 RepID=UPI0012D3FB8B|nr:hypothetical protein [Methanosarcina barkeri]